MKLVHAVNSTYNEVDRNLRILEDEGLVAQRYVGQRRYVSLNLKNEKTLAVFKILNLMEKSSLRFSIHKQVELYLK